MSSQIIPSNAGAPSGSSDPVEAVRAKLMDALRPHFKGKTAERRLEKAVDEAVDAIAGLITVREVSGKNLGAVVMTEAASMRNSHTGNFNKPPRKL